MRLVTILLSTACCLPLLTGAGFGQEVGVAAAVNQSARGTPPQRAVRTLVLGDRIIHDERIQTDAEGLLQILLADGTTFTVGPNSELTIDSFVYDPGAGTARIAASLGKGVFRFIGGKTSKTPEGVNLNTPVGTVGIRGAIVDMIFEAANGIPSQISMRYGNGLTLWPGAGTPTRLYKAGYSIVIGNANVIRVRRTTPQWTTLFQTMISGGNGGGGAPTKPTDGMVVASRIPNSNSAVPLQLDSIPIPTPRPPDQNLTVLTQASRDLIRQELNDGGGEEPPPPEPTEIPLRVLTAPYGAGQGIVGGTADSDQNVELMVEDGAETGTAALAQGAVTLPVYDDASFSSHSVNAAASPFGSLSGTAYSGPGGFTAYLLGIDGDPTRPFYAVTGMPTDMAAVFTGGGVRNYSLTLDPIQGVAVPFMTDNPAFDFATATVSNLLIAEPDAGGDGSGRVFQAWLMIDGTGQAQKSAIGVNVGALTGEGFSLDRRGSYRVTSGDASYHLFGRAATLAGTGGTGIFGPNGENFVLTDSLDGTGYFYDSAAGAFVAGADFSTIHVGNLEAETANPGRSISGTYEGFAAGVIEGVFDTGDGTAFSDRSTIDTDITIAFNPETRSLGGSFSIYTPSSFVEHGAPEGFTVEFGDEAEGGESAYINDATFAATGTGTYLVSGRPSDLTKTGADPNALCESCDFLEWGWWGTQAEVAADNPSGEAGRLSVHMGTWVAGDMATETEISALELANASATFEGMAAGNVLSGGNSYVAAGAMNLDYSFGMRSGELSIDDFDGRSFSGTVSGDYYQPETFSGYISGESASGSAGGAFVNNGADVAAGVIGSFEASDSDWQARGIFAGERTDLVVGGN